MAQEAERSSTNLFTHFYFKNTPRDEQGYILFIKQNAIQILIPKYGLEGTLYLRSSSDVEFQYDSSVPSQTVKEQGISLTLFKNVTVRILLDDSNVQHEKLVLMLVDPDIKGFSVPKLSESEDKETNEPPSKKRKTL